MMPSDYLKKRYASFGYAFRGLADLVRTQPNAQIHLVVSAMVLGAGFFFHLSRTEWMVVVGCMALVISLEAFNTAVEYVCDAVSPEYHPLIGKAKDVAAGGVLIGSCGAVVCGMLIFLPKIWLWLH